LKACVDVHYGATDATAACVLFRQWREEAAERELVVHVPAPPPYEPGAFYRRELPCLVSVLEPVRASLDLVLVDGYVWLDAHRRKGLGAHLHEALGGSVPVIGVAKTAFAGSDFAVAVLRGTSKRPLYVTAAGIDAEVAATHVRGMHGDDRIPTLLARVDRLARDARTP
jgi:deoxyribonuclease V